MGTEEDLVEREAAARRERLRALRAAKELLSTPDENAAADAGPEPRHRSADDVLLRGSHETDGNQEPEVPDEDSVSQAVAARHERLKALKAAKELLGTPDGSIQSGSKTDDSEEVEEEKISWLRSRKTEILHKRFSSLVLYDKKDDVGFVNYQDSYPSHFTFPFYDSCDDLSTCKQRADEHFAFHHTPVGHAAALATFHLQSEALEFHWSFLASRALVSWIEFLDGLDSFVGPASSKNNLGFKQVSPVGCKEDCVLLPKTKFYPPSSNPCVPRTCLLIFQDMLHNDEASHKIYESYYSFCVKNAIDMHRSLCTRA